MDCWAGSGPVGTSDQGSELPIGALVVHSGQFFLTFSIDPFISNLSIIQMARDRRGKQRETTPEIESDPSSDSEETHDARPPIRKKRKAVDSKVPKRARGRGKPLPQEGSSRPLIKQSAPRGS